MLEELKRKVLAANLELPQHHLVKYTWGNVSAIDRATGLFVIKPSGVDYANMTVADLVVCDLEGKVVEGHLNPSSDTPTHAVLYKAFPTLGGIVHTHATWATIWAQAGLDVPTMGTTHADTFYGAVPCTRYLTAQELENGYEAQSGNVIVQTFAERRLDPDAVPGVLLHGHGTFTWGRDAASAVMHAVVLEEVCKMNLFTRLLHPQAAHLPRYIVDKHYLRKHGKNAYYGQKPKK